MKRVFCCYRGLEFVAVECDLVLSQSQLTEPLWTDPGLKSGIGVRKLISTLKKEE